MTEDKERILAEISQFKVIFKIDYILSTFIVILNFLFFFFQMELKHAELLKTRLEDKLKSVKTDRDEMVC